MTVAVTQQADDTTDNPALARIRPWEPDPRWGVIPGTTPPRFTVRLSGPPEATALMAKARDDRRVMEAEIERACAARIDEAHAVFNAGDSTKKQRDAAVHEAHAERIAREDRLAIFDTFTRDAIIARAQQVAQAANEASWRARITAWQQQP